MVRRQKEQLDTQARLINQQQLQLDEHQRKISEIEAKCAKLDRKCLQLHNNAEENKNTCMNQIKNQQINITKLFSRWY